MGTVRNILSFSIRMRWILQKWKSRIHIQMKMILMWLPEEMR